MWTADPLLQVDGWSRRIRWGAAARCKLTNTAQTTQQIVQNTNGPSAFVYCYSVYVRSAVPATIQLVVTTTGQTALTPVTTSVFVDASDSHRAAFRFSKTASASECNCRQACKWTHSAPKWKHSQRPGCTRRPSTWAASIRARGFRPTCFFHGDRTQSKLLPDRFDQ